jgi:hypothetical protein
VPPELVSSLQPAPAADALAILISQDCDIVHESYEDEPYVELLFAKPAKERDGNLFHGKNPRRLQFEAQHTSGPQLYCVNINEKTRVDRALLVPGLPSTVALDDDTIDLLASWAAKRYTRAALPTEFNERCRASTQRIYKKLKAHGHLITGFLLQMNSYDELPKDSIYRVTLIGTCLPTTLQDRDQEQIAVSLLDAVHRELDRCEGIEVEDARLLSEEKVSLHDLRYMLPWDFDHVSYRSGDPDGIAPR